MAHPLPGLPSGCREKTDRRADAPSIIVGMSSRPRPRICPRRRSPSGDLRKCRTILFLLVPFVATLFAPPLFAKDRDISCLGRLEPGLGIVHVASPSVGGGVIASLAVAEGDWVEKGQVLGILDDHALRAAEVARLEAELVNATREAERARRLSRQSATSAAKLDTAELGVRVAEANLSAAGARLELTRIRAPIRGLILEIHTRPGERAAEEGVLEMGDTAKMVAVAEVYETDIGAVEKGQRARITSPALDGPLLGVVASIGLKIGRMDALDSDPIAKTDARVVEVRIELDSSETVAALTNLLVEVEIER